LKSQFFEMNDKELENVNKGSSKVSKHVKIRAMNVFNEWRPFRGFDSMRFISNLF
jgi:hypothetical protein